MRHSTFLCLKLSKCTDFLSAKPFSNSAQKPLMNCIHSPLGKVSLRSAQSASLHGGKWFQIWLRCLWPVTGESGWKDDQELMHLLTGCRCHTLSYRIFLEEKSRLEGGRDFNEFNLRLMEPEIPREYLDEYLLDTGYIHLKLRRRSELSKCNKDEIIQRYSMERKNSRRKK